MGLEPHEKKKISSSQSAMVGAALIVEKTAFQVKLTCDRRMTCIRSKYELLEQSFIDFSYCFRTFVETLTKFNVSEDNDLCFTDHKNPDEYFTSIESIYLSANEAWETFLKANVVDVTTDGPLRDPLLFSTPNQNNVSRDSNVTRSAAGTTLSQPGSTFRFGGERYNFVRRSLPVLPDAPTPVEWLEWKAQWTSNVVPYFGEDLLGLARATKDNCGKQAKFEVSHISIHEPNAYQYIWDALCARYDNVSFNIHSVMSEMSKLKKVLEGDAKGVLLLFRKVKGVYGQLRALGHVDKVDYLRLSSVVALLPLGYQESWSVIYSTLDANDRCHPFEQFIKFIDSKMKAVQDQADFKLAMALQTGNSPSVQPRSNRGRNFSMETHALDSTKCVNHPHSGHSTGECRDFCAKSPKEKHDVCVEHNLCTRCLTPKHDGVCPIKYNPCSKCNKRDRPASHCEELCYAGQRLVEKSYGRTSSRSFKPPSDKGEKSTYGQNHSTCGDAHPSSPPMHGQTSCHMQLQSAECGVVNPYSSPGMHSGCSIQPPGRSIPPVSCSHATLSCCHVQHKSNGCINQVEGAVIPSGPRPHKSPSCVANHPVTDDRLCSAPGQNERQSDEASSDKTRGGTLSAHGHNTAVFETAFISHLDSALSSSIELPSPMEVESNEIDSSPEKIVKEFSKVSGIYAIGEVPVPSNPTKAIIFYDQGSDVTCFDEEGVKALKPRVLDHGTLTMTTINSQKKIKTQLLEVPLCTRDGYTVTVTGYSVPRLCGKPYQLNLQVLKDAFPNFDSASLQRPLGTVNILLGADYYGYFPKHEIATSGHLSIMKGVLSTCVVGSHPDIVERSPANNYAGYHISFSSYNLEVSTRTDTPVLPVQDVAPSVLPVPSSSSSVGGSTPETSPELTPVLENVSPEEGALPASRDPLPVGGATVRQPLRLSHAAARIAHESYSVGAEQAAMVEKFILGDELGTSIKPLCGACKCGKCPIPGQTFSFKEEQELELIQSKLRYLPESKHWITGYPWKVDPATMPDNYAAAYSTLCRTERTLSKDPAWGSTYQLQIDDHITRGVARKLTDEEIRNWTGPYFYLAHMALEQPKSESTPVRLVFNSSQSYKGVSLNSCLAKGPDCYNNTLFGSLLRMREYPILMIGDIRKMYNTIRLEMMEQHMHRFLWRECDSNRKPDVYVITRVNLGDKPSGTIAITAKNNTAHLFSHICPEAAQVLIYCCYTDDLINSILKDFAHALYLASKIDEILAQGDFKVKAWLFGGLSVPEEHRPVGLKQLLGCFYRSSDDSIVFPAKLNFSAKRRKVPTGPNLTVSDLPEGIPNDLSRRIVLQQVMSIYDPLGLLAPLVLQAKILLRRTWELKLGWDEVLPSHMVIDWKVFFASLFEAEKIPFARCLTPDGAVGRPSLILFSDGSELAYGCVGYIRWKLSDGSYWCRIIMAKCRIAPISRINIPQMELNGAVTSKRLRQAILSETRMEFEQVYHFIDSETVLHQLSRIAQRFGVYEGVRIGEIQSATSGDMSDWNWIAGEINVGDLTTRPQGPESLGPESIWQRGPDFLYLDESQWPCKGCPTVDDELAPGEKYYSFASRSRGPPPPDKRKNPPDIFSPSLTRCSRVSITIGAFARIKSALQRRSFRGGQSQFVTPLIRQSILVIMLRSAQASVWCSHDSVKAQHRTLAPELNSDGLWIVGSRVSACSPFTPENLPQVLLPRHHILTLRLMEEAHSCGRHSGRDPTLARFRSRYVTSKAPQLAAMVCKVCRKCKLLKVRLTQQKMGPMPPDRLLPGPVFNTCVLDLFGPYYVKAENQKRTLMKVWGVIIVDLVCRAVHIDITSGYDTRSFLVAFSRFASLRGYPSVIYSDPGTQLVGASKEITSLWSKVREDQDGLSSLSARGCQWIFGPADSPWYQGTAEALIKSAKRALDLSVHNSKLLFSELLASFYEVANLLNERPIGYLPSLDNSISVLTPNMLLLGRSTSRNPGGYERPTETSLHSLVILVQDVVNTFWTHWTELYAPTLLSHSKWLFETTPLKKDDVVLVADQNTVRGDYRVAIVKEVHPSKDGIVRRVSVRYKNYRAMTKDFKLVGGHDQVVQRSVQRLSLLVPS